MREIGMGVIGWGFMGKTHTHVLREMPLFYPGAGFIPVLKAICTRRDEKAREAARLCGFEKALTDYRELLKLPDVEAVSICTPNGDHARMALDALAAGKHVYIDKPMCMNAAEAEAVAEAVRQSGKCLQVANNNRFWPSVMRAKQLIDEGRVGNVLSFRCDYLHSGSIDPNKPVGWKQRSEGGVLLDLASHALDLMVWLVGGVREVFCETRALYPERPLVGGGVTRDLGEDQVIALLRLRNGAVGTVEASKIATGTDDEISFEIYGDKGALRWKLMRADYLEFYDNALPEAALGGMRGFTSIASVARFPAPGGQFLPVKNTVGWDRSHMHCYYSFLQCVCEGTKPSPDAEEALYLQRLMDAMRVSAEERRWVEVEGEFAAL